jgi:integrase
MARTVRNPKLDTRSARAKLAMRDSPYWVSLAPGCALGYRKGPKGGVWLAKLVRDALRQQITIGPADDALDPDGVLAIGYADAQTRARERFATVTKPANPTGPYTVRNAVTDYLDWFRATGRKSVNETEASTKAFIVPVNASPERLRTIVRGALLSGARYSELAGMHVADFHRDSGTLLVRTSKAGKVRHIELTGEGLEFFNEITAGHGATEVLFHRDGTAWGKSHQQRLLAEACRAAKITPAASFHTLRHTYASLMVMDAVPLMVVARNLGHADTRMVEKHYGHLATSYVREAISALSRSASAMRARWCPGGRSLSFSSGLIGRFRRNQAAPLIHLCRQ